MQEKSKAEDQLVSSAALIRKNVKDYNDLLRFSAEIQFAFEDLFKKLKSAYNEE